MDHSLFQLLEPGDVSALLQVPNALIVVLLGDKVAIDLQRDLLVLSVQSLYGFIVRLWFLTGSPRRGQYAAAAAGGFLEVLHSGIEVITGR